MLKTKKILVAPLNWGLGHATRCIPIINALIDHNFEPIIASDGVALNLLKHEFPNLKFYDLPSYNITYSKKASGFKLKIIKDTPKLLKNIKKEKKAVAEIIKNETIDGIISDNRFGVRHKKIPSVFISHQIRVLSGTTTWFSSKFHQKIIKKFNECWIPDYEGDYNLSGDLGHVPEFNNALKYIGPLSRFEKKDIDKKYNLLVVISGPEPQRTMLEDQLTEELKSYNGKVCFVKGKINKTQKTETKDHITFYNFMTSTQLEKAINESETILSRSGYTSIMDYAKLEKKVFFIPTPGQFEQVYLAKKFKKEGIAPYCKQEKFKLNKLDLIEDYSGLKYQESSIDFESLFRLF